MEVHDLVRMANQIAGFFSAYPHDEAVKETLYHLEHFWDPRMRHQLVERIVTPDILANHQDSSRHFAPRRGMNRMIDAVHRLMERQLREGAGDRFWADSRRAV